MPDTEVVGPRQPNCDHARPYNFDRRPDCFGRHVDIRLAEANHLDIRHLIFLADIRMPAKVLSVTAVTRGKTIMMMVIRAWREPVI